MSKKPSSIVKTATQKRSAQVSSNRTEGTTSSDASRGRLSAQLDPNRVRKIAPSSQGVVTDDPVSGRPYFCGLLPRDDVQMLLKNNGEFAVRKVAKTAISTKFSNLCISVKWDSKVHHFVIPLSNNGLYQLEKEEFKTVDDLVNFYHLNQRLLSKKTGAKLMTPIEDPGWFLRDDQLDPVAKLGEGNFGQVWKARFQPKDGSGSGSSAAGGPIGVAVKFLKDTGVPEEERKLFFSECRKLRQLKHRHLVGFIGLVVDTEPIKLVMELCDTSLLSHLKNDRLNWTRKTRVCLHVARGMEYLAGCKVIHRDLAARNCLLKNDVVKIADLGMSKVGKFFILKDRLKPIPIKWTCPQTIRTRRYGEYSDVWSFAVFLWEVYSNGQRPYEEMQVEFGSQFAEKLILFLQSGQRLKVPTGTPRELEDLMLNCMQWNVNDRPMFSSIRQTLEEIYQGYGCKLSYEKPPDESYNSCKEADEE